MNKSNIKEIMRPQYEVFYSKDGIDYEMRIVPIWQIVKICDYYYRDMGFDRRQISLPESSKFIAPVYFHHNDYWIVDGIDLARVIDQMTVIHKRDWRKVVNGKWRLQPDWLFKWHENQKSLQRK